MAAPLVDISILGDKALERKLAALTEKQQARAVRNSLKKLSTQVKRWVISKVSGGLFDDPTGALLSALKATPTKAASMKTLRKGFLAAVWKWPERSTLGEAGKAKGFKPTAIEYGHVAKGGVNVPAKSYVRSTLNEKKVQAFSFLRTDIGKQIERIFRTTK